MEKIVCKEKTKKHSVHSRHDICGCKAQNYNIRAGQIQTFHNISQYTGSYDDTKVSFLKTRYHVVY